MKKTIFGKIGVTALLIALASPALLPADDHDRDHHDDHRYYDRNRRDYHRWDDREDRAYHMYWEQRHHSYTDFDRLNARQQNDYWNWRHSHSDAILQINIR